MRQISSVEELQAALSTDLFDLDRQQSAKISEILGKAGEQSVLQTQKIEQQNQEIQMLQTKVTKLKKQIENQETSVNTTRTGFFQSNSETDAEYYHKIVQEVEDQFQTQLRDLDSENKRLSLENGDLRTAKGTLQNQLIQSQDERLDEVKAKEEVIKAIQQPFQTSTEFEDCFEDALRESFEKMKSSYQNKLEQQEQDMVQLQRKRNVEIYDLKQENKRESETKRLLMKKLGLFIKI